MIQFEWLSSEVFLTNAAILVAAALILRWTFPKRIRQAMERNTIRLDGSFSKNRKSVESFFAQGHFIKSWSVIALFVLVGNLAFFQLQSHVIPGHILGAAIGEFDWNAEVWNDRLNDPSRGSLAQRYLHWKDSSGSRSRSESLIRVLSAGFFVGAFALMAAVFGMVVLIRIYIRALLNLENGVIARRQGYLMHDMESRFEALEKSRRRKRRLASKQPGASRESMTG